MDFAVRSVLAGTCAKEESARQSCPATSRMTTKIRNGHSLMRSARVPETIDAVVAQNTIWKNQSEPVAYVFAISLPGSGIVTGMNLPINSVTTQSSPGYIKL